MSFSQNHARRTASDDDAEEDTVLILYATETGTAQDVADRIARECRRIYLKCRVSSMHAYPLVYIYYLFFSERNFFHSRDPQRKSSFQKRWSFL